MIKQYLDFCYGEDVCGETKCINVELNTYKGCEQCLKERIEQCQRFLKEIKNGNDPS